MILSKNFVHDYTKVDDVEIDYLTNELVRIGNESESVTKLINATNLTIGEVLECKDHPESDHLHICKVDVGTEVLDIICGAPNVRKGLKVIVALNGAVLPGGTIKKTTILGCESNGMLCSLQELGLENKYLTENDINGIHELDEFAIVGEDPIKYLELDDVIIDLELTANRADLLSTLGLAYEVSAITDREVIEPKVEYNEIKENVKDEIALKVDTENVYTFLVKKVKDIVIKESPTFIKNRLMACGIRPINNVVDISNYVMLETGQPLHFYDADTLGKTISPRMAENGETVVTLDNTERILTSEDIVITDGKKTVGLAGVMGGLNTEIEENTKNVIIESAIFNPLNIRNTSKKILRSEASIRFEKGLDVNRCYLAIERACTLLEKYADAEIVTGIVKYDVTDNKEKVIEITYKEINDVLGTNISKEDIVEVFRKLDFKTEVKDELVIVTVPTRRIDISIRADLIEEIGRIYGVDNIQGKLPVVPMKMGHLDRTTRKIRAKMSNMGLNETLSYILINDKDVHKFTIDQFEEVRLLDPITEDRNTLRYSMIPSLYKIYEYNKARENKDVCLFEIGKGFWKKGEEYGENQKICVLMTGEYYTGIGHSKNVDFFDIKGITEELLDYLGYGGRYSFVLPKNMPAEFHPGQTAEISVNNDIVGIVGRIHPSVEKEAVYVMEINLDKLLEKRVGKMKFKEISKFPTMKKDVAVLVSKDMTSKDIEMLIKKKAGKLLLDIKVFDVYEGKNIDENKRSIAYSLTFGNQDRTLNDDEINNILEGVINDLESKGIEIRK